MRDATLALLPELAARRPAPFLLFLHLRDVHSARGMKRPGNPLYNSPPEFRNAFLPHPEVGITCSPQDIWDGKVQLTEEQAANVVAQYDGGILYVDALLREIEFRDSHRLVATFAGPGRITARLLKRVKPLTLSEAEASISALDLPDKYKAHQEEVLARIASREDQGPAREATE